MSNSFNFDEALKDLQAGKDLTGKDGRGGPHHLDSKSRIISVLLSLCILI